MSDKETTFDPAKHLIDLKGQDYLPVKWRVVWLRTEHPDAVIETEHIRLDDVQAIFRASVRIPSGGSATGYGSETPGDFRDYIEKAEQKSIGRALAALGYGTQFAEPDTEADAGRIVDAPVERRSRQPQRSAAPTPIRQSTDSQVPAGDGATPRQLKFIQSLSRETGLSDDAVAAEVELLYGCTVSELSRRDASSYIERLHMRKGNLDLPSEGAAATPDQPASQPTAQRATGGSMTDRQANFLRGLAKDLGLTIIGPDGEAHANEQEMDALCDQVFHKTFQELTAKEASELIEDWKNERDNRRSDPYPPAQPAMIAQTDAAIASRPGQPGNDQWSR